MRYLSLFSGIGGFEVAIHQVFGNKAECVAYSEIDKHAITEYERHYPNHQNLGDVTKIKKKDIDGLGRIDLVVAGFPCSDLSSVKHKDRQGLDGTKSGLFWTMLKIMKWAKTINPDLKFIIENNASMAHKWRDMITDELTKLFHKKVYCNYFDSSQWVVQRRRRYYWTLSEIPEYKGKRKQNMNDVLIPIAEAKKFTLSDKAIAYLNASPSHLISKHGEIIIKKDNCYLKQKVPYPTRLSTRGSSTKNDYISCLVTKYDSCFLLDYRLCKGEHSFLPRYLAKTEFNNLFGYPKNYIKNDHTTIFTRLYGMSVVPLVIKYILNHI